MSRSKAIPALILLTGILAMTALGIPDSRAAVGPPTITNITADGTEVLPYQDISIFASVSGAQTVDLHYRIGSSGDFTSTPIDITSKSIYQTMIVDPDTPDGSSVEFYVSATNVIGTSYFPDGTPGTVVHTINVVFVNEVMGLYLDEETLDSQIMTGSDGQSLEALLMIRYPHIWTDKAGGAVHYWQCQLKVVGTFMHDPWNLENDVISSAVKTVVADTTTFKLHVFPGEDGGVLQSTGTRVYLGYFRIYVPTTTTELTFYIEPMDGGYATPGYSPDNVIWRPIGTSSGGNPNNPGELWDQPVATINIVGSIIKNQDSTWGAVKALYR